MVLVGARVLMLKQVTAAERRAGTIEQRRAELEQGLQRGVTFGPMYIGRRVGKRQRGTGEHGGEGSRSRRPWPAGSGSTGHGETK